MLPSLDEQLKSFAGSSGVAYILFVAVNFVNLENVLSVQYLYSGPNIVCVLCSIKNMSLL